MRLCLARADNLLLTAANRIKISDFGVAQVLQAHSTTQSATTPRSRSPDQQQQQERRSRRFSGTPAFASPEQIADPHGNWDRRGADIWALGVILFRLMHGRMPSKAKSVFETYATIADPAAPDPVGNGGDDPGGAAAPPPLLQPLTSFSEPLWDLLRHLMDRDHTRRYTIEQVVAHEWIQQAMTIQNDTASSPTTSSLNNSTES